MLRVEVDMFSGRPNPVWIETSESLTSQVLDRIREDRALASKPGSGFQGLGFRGVRIQVLGGTDEGGRLPAEFVIANGSGATLKRGADLAETILKGMTKAARIVLPEHALTPVDRRTQALAISALHDFRKSRWKERRTRAARYVVRRRTIQDTKCPQCQYEVSLFNPAFWNSDPYVRTRNNCYNYARNWRTDTFAQPGRASGNPTSTMQCTTVSNSARSDGLVDRCRKCLPFSEYPRRLMALVIAPNYDFHWYRHQMGGFWGHKPGGTAARNTDNSGVLITNPETCNRGPYTSFCGYFYAGKSVTIA